MKWRLRYYIGDAARAARAGNGPESTAVHVYMKSGKSSKADASKSRWDRLKAWFLNTRWGVFVAAVLAVAGAAGTVLELLREGEAALSEADLTILPLSEPSSLEALDGHDRIPAAGRLTFAGGFKVKLHLSHNKQGSHTITIDRLSLGLDSFTQPAATDRPYALNPSSLPPQGSAVPHRFILTVTSQGVNPATWIPPESGAVPRLAQEAGNMLATDPPLLLKLNAATGDTEDVYGTVRMLDPGWYRVRFRIHYSINGKARQHETEVVTVYTSR